MTKKEKYIDYLRNIILCRYEIEGKTLTPDMANSIWYDLLGTYEREGTEAAELRAKTANLQ